MEAEEKQGKLIMRTGNAQAWNTLPSQAKITTFKMENTLLSLPGRDTTPFFMRDLRIKLKKKWRKFLCTKNLNQMMYSLMPQASRN